MRPGLDGEPAGPIIRLHPTEVISLRMEFAGEWRETVAPSGVLMSQVCC